MLHDVDAERMVLVRRLAQTISPENEAFASTSPTLIDHALVSEISGSIADLLSNGLLCRMHPAMHILYRRTSGVTPDRERVVQLRPLRDALHEIAIVANRSHDPELRELSYVLRLLTKAISITPERLTLMRDGSRQPFPILLHQLAMTTAKPLLALAKAKGHKRVA